MEKRSELINYNNNELHFDNVNINNIGKKFKTPFYLYSKNELERSYNEFANGIQTANIDGTICFALKSNANPTLLKDLARLGAGADIVSGGELIRAIESDIPANKIVFSGVGKTQDEIDLGIAKGIKSFNVESIEELDLIAQRAQHYNSNVPVAIRLNPKVQALTHKHISTGFKTHKFGLLTNDIIELANNESYWENLSLKGLSVHIGSQLTNLDASLLAFRALADCSLAIKNHHLEFLDVGGGLGVNYSHSELQAPSIDEYMSCVKEGLKNSPINHIVFEPGRRIIASCGIFITSVIRSKSSEDCHFLIVDGGMNDFVRPSLYGAYHEICEGRLTENKVNTDIVGPICETADCFGEKRILSKLSPGDNIAILDTGAYGYTMSSHYNLRSKPRELYIDKGNISLISKENSY